MATSAKNGNGKAAKKRPVISKRYWPVQVAVFEFENEGRVNHSIEVTRTFRRDGESEWETSSYLTSQDLLPAARLLEEAYSEIQARMQRHFADRHGDAGSDGEF
ncbi:MAG: hypothetical protein U0795_23335 [Pirellulales bacterium]